MKGADGTSLVRFTRDTLTDASQIAPQVLSVRTQYAILSNKTLYVDAPSANH